MKNVLFFALTLFVTIASAQNEITYPYNPDSDDDQYVSVSDVLNTVSSFGSEFNPAEIQIDGVGLAEVIGQLQASISALEVENAVQAVFITDLNLQVLELQDMQLPYLGQDLSGEDLSGQDLSGEVMIHANLSDANLNNANLSFANLFAAFLSGVTWTGAYIDGCSWCDCIDADGDNYCD